MRDDDGDQRSSPGALPEETTDAMRDITRKLAREQAPEAPGTGTLPSDPKAPANEMNRRFHEISPEAARRADDRRREAEGGDDLSGGS